MGEELAEQLQKEWREQVLQRLNNLADGQERLNEKISSFETRLQENRVLKKLLVINN